MKEGGERAIDALLCSVDPPCRSGELAPLGAKLPSYQAQLLDPFHAESRPTGRKTGPPHGSQRRKRTGTSHCPYASASRLPEVDRLVSIGRLFCPDGLASPVDLSRLWTYHACAHRLLRRPINQPCTSQRVLHCSSFRQAAYSISIGCNHHLLNQQL